MIVGKSNKNNDDFDVLVFAYPDVTSIVIPSSIRIISSYSFYSCDLSCIDFERESKLTSIGDYSFTQSNLYECTIPKSVTHIGKEAFNICMKLQHIRFDQNSKLSKLPKGMFDMNYVSSFMIPENVERIDDNWIKRTINLENLSVSKDNRNFSYLDENHKILVGKSDIKSKQFDVIVFACRDVEQIFIPSTIKHIKPFAFTYCRKLKTVEFAEDSIIESFESNLFNKCESLEKIKIPSSVKRLESYCFFACNKLKTIEIAQNSQLTSINKFCFYKNPIENLFLPPKLETIQNYWQSEMKNLTNIVISPDNKHFKYLDNENKIIIGKSKLDSDFDVIFFCLF